jgi:hypothetical protein
MSRISSKIINERHCLCSEEGMIQRNIDVNLEYHGFDMSSK